MYTFKGRPYIVVASCTQCGATPRKLTMQICVTDLFIEPEEQSNKQNNAYRNKTCEDDILSLIESDGGQK